MTSIFVFTAGSGGPQEHLELSIKNPISNDLVYEKLRHEHGDLLELVMSQVGGFYAWGARPTPKLKNIWDEMQPGDEVLCVYGGKYRYRAQIVAKCHDRDFAMAG